MAVARVEDCPPLGPDDLAVVFDVLRMSTAMLSAAAAGVAAIFPVETVETARERARDFTGAWLAGERHNRPPAGFQRGNSPVEWATPVPHGTRVVWTTTNGTRALERVADAGAVLVGALVNRSAVAQAAAVWPGRVVLVGAGREGGASPPDWWGVGAVVAALGRVEADPSAEAAQVAYAAVADDLGRALAASDEGHGLETLGYGADVAWAAGLDRVPTVLHRAADGWLTPAAPACLFASPP